MRFEPGDFEPLVGYHSEIADKIAELVNARIAEWLADAPTTDSDWDPRWSDEEINRYMDGPFTGQTWRARLVAIEEIRTIR